MRSRKPPPAPRVAAMLPLSLLSAATSIVSATPPPVATAGLGASRAVPRYGFGNELVLQSTNDSNVAAAFGSSGGTIARYPGGTPSDYWRWDTGWMEPGAPCQDGQLCGAGTGNYPVRGTTPAQVNFM